MAAAIDGALMAVGAIYIVFVATSFIDPFQAFLITLGTPIAAWCGIFLADLTLRRRDYSEADLFDGNGRYGRVNVLSVFVLVAATALGWGLITNPMSHVGWMNWLGYLLGPLGLGGKTGAWAGANLGVLAALGVGYLGVVVFGRRRIRTQESILQSV
jgi:purine-cytosine permease-like protein